MRPPAATDARTRREWAARIGLVLLSVVLTGGAVELALRALGVGATPPPAVARVIAPRYRGMLDCYPSNPRHYFDVDLRTAAARERYFHLAPLRYDTLCARTPWAVEFEYNALRFRDAPPGPRMPGRTRVVVFGDSFTEGQGVKASDTLPSVLGRELERTAPGRFEVRNCGRRGTDFPALHRVFEDMVAAYDPQVVVWAMVLNDAERSEAYERQQRYVNDWILLNMNSTEEPRTPAPIRLFGFLRDRIETARIAGETTRWYRDMYGARNAEGWARTQEQIRHMHGVLEERGAKLLVLLWPLLVDLDGDYPFEDVHRTVDAFFLKAGIDEIDLLPLLRGTDARSLWVHEVDRHPNEMALRRAAEAVRPRVEALEARD